MVATPVISIANGSDVGAMRRERATRKPCKRRRLDREASLVVVVVVWDKLKPMEIRPWIYNLQERVFSFFFSLKFKFGKAELLK